MKIIGTNGRDGCIVYMTKDEVAQLAGFHSAYARDIDRIRMEPGSEVAVAKLYNDATFLLGLYADLKRDVATNQTRLNRLAELLNRGPVAKKEGAA